MADESLIERIFEFQNKLIIGWIQENLPKEKIEELTEQRHMSAEMHLRMCVAIMEAIIEGNKAYASKVGREGLPLFPTSFDDISPATSTFITWLVIQYLQNILKTH